MRGLGWMLAGCVALGGCAARGPRSATRPAEAMASPTTRPVDLSRLSLDQIEPRPVLATPAPAPATRPARGAPLEALQLYARSVDAQQSGDRQKEIGFLRQALAIDPDSFSLNYALGMALAGSGNGNEAAIEKLKRAAEIQPDHLDTQLQLGRQYLARNNLARALSHLRVATLTRDYQQHTEDAAMVDWYLARALQQKGYDRAAIDQYESLLRRLAGRLSFRGNPELWYLHAHPESIHHSVARLYEKLGDAEQALRHFGDAMRHAPDSFAIQADLVRLLIRTRQLDEARDLAVDLLADQHASTESVQLVKEVFSARGQQAGVVEEVKRILAKHPDDRRLMFGLADALVAVGRSDEAAKLLAEAVATSRAEVMVVWKLFEFHQARDDAPAAARLLIDALAVRPESLGDFQALWMRMARGGKFQIRLADVQAMDVPPAAQASKLYWQARTALLGSRSAVARSLLERAVAMSPVFDPAYRDLLTLYLSRTDWNDDQKMRESWKLIDRAGDGSRKALAAELQGLLLMAQNKPGEAAEAFGRAVLNGDRSPGVKYLQATALIAAGRTNEAEALLWQIISQWPGYGAPYQALYQHFQSITDKRQAERVLQMWLSADPFNLMARLLQAQVFAGHGRHGDAEAVLLRVFQDAPDNGVVLGHLSDFFRGREDELIKHLEAERERNPANLAIAAELASRHHVRKRTTDAVRVLDALRSAVAGSPDRLLIVGELYQQIDQAGRCEQVMREVLRLDPASAQANNYLGYLWADEGRNLVEAERMIRLAVSAEPENEAYLDSLGWVLYKRGRFDEARRYLAQAAGAMPDPVVLDHLGDALYRLQKVPEAVAQWQQSLDSLSRMTTLRDELTKLKAVLQRKLEQHKARRPVEVAPVEAGTQAKN